MSDLVKRLRVAAQRIRKQVEHLGMKLPSPSIEEEAAAHIEAQDERIKALEAGLKPFADEMEKRAFKTHPHWPDSQAFIGFNFTLGDLRHAASLLEAKP
mgnify:FL=1